jgi:hypothetical protein
MSSTISQSLIDTANALGHGALISPEYNGKRKVSGRLLSPTDSGYASASSSPSTSDVEFPIGLYSVQALMWAGFNASKA